ncbi:MAG: hypothetical protein LBN37_02795, partial [Bacteroidales bacterium]|nr:hypothetical protein [Bacteroidales bacterium]
METYNKSILEYNDVRNAMDYVKRTSLQEGMQKALTNLAIKYARRGMNVIEIADWTDLSIEQVK